MDISNNKGNLMMLISFVIGLFPLIVPFTSGFPRFIAGIISFIYPGILIAFIISGGKRLGIIEYLSILLVFSIVSLTSIAVFLNLIPLGISPLYIVVCLTVITSILNIYLFKTRFFHKELKFDLTLNGKIFAILLVAILSVSIFTRLVDPLLFSDTLPYWDSYYWLYLSNFEVEIGHTPQVVLGILNLYRHGYDLFFASLSLITGLDLITLYSFFCPIFGGFFVLPLFHIGNRILKSNALALFFALLICSGIPFGWLFVRTAIPRAELFGLYLILVLGTIIINPSFDFRSKLLLSLAIIWSVYIFHLYSFLVASLIFLIWLGIILADKYSLNKRLSTMTITIAAILAVALLLFFFNNTINMILGIEIDLTYGSSISEFNFISFVIGSGIITLIPIIALIGIFYFKKNESSFYTNDGSITLFMRLIIIFWIFLASSLYLIPNILVLDTVPWPVMRLESYYQLITIIASMFGVCLILESLTKGKSNAHMKLRIKSNRIKKYITHFNLRLREFREHAPLLLILSLSIMSLVSLSGSYVDYAAVSEGDFAAIITLSSNYSISNENLTFAIVGENLMNDGNQYNYFLYYSFNTNSSDLNFYFPQILNGSDLIDYLSVTNAGHFNGTRYVLISSRCSQVLRIHAMVLLSMEGYELLQNSNSSIYVKG